jgi:hypothetical protein
MFSKKRETPLTQAVISDDLQVIRQLGRYRDQVMAQNELGYNALELAHYLGKDDLVKYFQPSSSKTILAITSDGKELKLTEESFELFFGVKYLTYSKFSDYSLFQKVLGSCSWILKSDFLASEILEVGKKYKEHALGQDFSFVTIQWIDEVLGYGLFANRDIEEGEYIGEYTGVISPIARFKDRDNEYCVNYPRMVWAINRYGIDAKFEGNEARFLNHSYQPNVVIKMAVDRDLIHPLFFSCQKIIKGKQLTFDYGKDYWRNRQNPVAIVI